MADEKPVLIEAAPSAQTEGATFTLQYKNRFLYSKYNPLKNILQAVQNLEILPGTLILAFSPCLFYGFKELQEKCRAAKSEILCVEADSALHSFASQEIIRQDLAATLLPFDKNTASGLDEFFNKASQKFRRVVRLDLSAGVSFNDGFYKNFYECAQNIVAAFWKNRLTLVRLGRLYSKNIFKNLPLAAARPSFEAFEGTVEKPILVCGAGESLDELTNYLQDQEGAAAQTDTGCKTEKAAAINQAFFTLAVDAAVPALLAAGIKIDAIAATESQLAIEKAYIGLGKNCLQDQEGGADGNHSQDKNCGANFDCAQDKNCGGPIFFFDLTSRASIARRYANRAVFYFSEFDQNDFLRRLKENGLLPKIAPPLGSIGLTATYLALSLRKGQDVPVYVLGLDFSFSAGRTHAKATAQSKALFLAASRLRPAQNCAAAYSPGAEKVLGKDGRQFWASKNLMGYAALFKNYFSGAKNLYDAGKSGLDLGLEKQPILGLLEIAAAQGPGIGSDKNAGGAFVGLEQKLVESQKNAAALGHSNDLGKKAQDFLRGELSALRALADLLSNGEGSEERDKSIALGEQILRELRGREYLYLHFPDGTAPSLEQNFLTRVRTQIDFFAKDIETALAVD